MKSQAIIPTAGLGKRFNSAIPKTLIKLNGKPIIVHTLLAFQKSSVHGVILVVHQDYIAEYKKLLSQYKLSKVKSVVAGGATRCASVKKGLAAIDENTDFVVIHDGARPLVSSKLINDSIKAAVKYKAVVAAVLMKPTIKRVDAKSLLVQETLNRDELWEVQTPQTFQREILLKAHQKNKDPKAGDDAVLIEKMGHPVKILKGDYKNIKITTPEDLSLAQVFLSGVGRT
jgi:2-C-methyl-D-erythritol 4-phosphate cytidylyltransferase